MAVEATRSCGYRKVGGLYLCGGGMGMACDRIPYKVDNCPVCGSGLKFTRGWTWLDWLRYAGEHSPDQCHHTTRVCPICFPVKQNQPYGLIWVGEKFYSPDAFVREAQQLGISRRLAYTGDTPRIPKNLKIGSTWVLFAHKHVILTGKDEHGVDTYDPAIFYAFRPTRLELLIWEKDATEERLIELEDAGVIPVVIPNDDKDHDPSTPLGLAKEDKRELENKILFTDLRKKLGR